MKQRLIRELVRLASMDYQEKNVIAGSSSSYALPEELLENAEGTLKTILANRTLSQCFSEFELESARAFLEDLSSAGIPFGDDSIPNETLILDNESWASARQAAQTFLTRLGIDPSDYNNIRD